MDVNVVDHLNTHAVVGGGKAGSLGISADGGLMRNLTIALYRYPMVAAFREPLCNGWDAHIDTNQTDRPLQVEITEDEISIRDFGTGIPHDEVPFIYGTYGHSTKTKDQKQTGGFGLGSKAPMAYATNFTVENRHKGKLSIWNFSRGSADTDGRPDYRKIVEVSCNGNEKGVTVKIPIVKVGDEDKITEIIKQIAYVGGIKMKINTRLAGFIDYEAVEKAGLPFVLVPKNRIPEYLRENSQNGVQYLVKLGSVLYPAPEMTQEPFHGRKMNLTPGHYAMVMLATGGTMNMTPSRETLNMTSLTEQSFEALVEKCKAWLARNLDDCIEAAAKKFHGTLSFESFTDINEIASAWDNITHGYQFILERGRYSYHANESYALLDEPAKMKDQFSEFIAARGEYKAEIAKRLSLRDPGQSQFKNQLLQNIREHYPMHRKWLLKRLLNSKSSKKTDYINRRYSSPRSLDTVLYRFTGRSISRWLRRLEQLDGAVARMVSLNHSMTTLSSLEWNGEYTKGTRASYDTDRVIGKVAQHGCTRIHDYPIVLAQSDASVERVLKNSSHKSELAAKWDKPYFRVVCRSRKNYEEALVFLRDVVKCKNLVIAPDYDILPKPQKEIETLYAWGIAQLDRDSRGRYRYKHSVEPIDAEDRDSYDYFIMSPSAQLFNHLRTNDKRNKGKIDIPGETLLELSKEYPKLIVCPMAAEAKLLEKEGKVNVLEDIAKRAITFINDADNVEMLFTNIERFSQFNRYYRMSLLLQILSPAEILEAMGRNPSYDQSLVGALPAEIELFVSIAALNHTPNCGMQYIHNASSRVSQKIADYFGNELRDILDEPGLISFLDMIPRKLFREDSKELKDQRVSPLIKAAVIAAIQTAKLQKSLRMLAQKP